MKTLDDTNAPESLRQAPRHLRAELAALTERWTQLLERPGRHDGEEPQGDQDEQRHHQVDGGEEGERDDGGDRASDQLNQAGSHQITDPFDIVHDAGDQLSGFHAVEETHGQCEYMPLDLGAELGDQVLRFEAEEKREEISGSGLNGHGHHQGSQ